MPIPAWELGLIGFAIWFCFLFMVLRLPVLEAVRMAGIVGAIVGLVAYSISSYVIQS